MNNRFVRTETDSNVDINLLKQMNHRCLLLSLAKTTNHLFIRYHHSSRDMEDLPNELCLMIFSYLTKCQLIETFTRLNQRFDRLLGRYLSHVYLSANFTRNDFKSFEQIQSWIRSVTIENERIGREFLRRYQLNNLQRIKFIDQIGNNFNEEISNKYQPEIFHFVFTSFQQQNSPFRIQCNSLKEVQLDFYQSEYAKK